jgi:hypothetical protein
MHLLDYILLVLATASGLFAGVGGVMLTLPAPRYRAIRLSFIVAAICFGCLGIFWGMEASAYKMSIRMSVAGATAAIAAMALVYVLSLIGESDKPKLNFSPAGQAYDLYWNTQKALNVSFKTDDQIDKPLWSNPAFTIENKSNVIVYDVEVSWQAEVASVPDLIKSSSKFEKYKPEFKDDQLWFNNPSNGPPMPSFVYDIKKQYVEKIPIIAKTREIYWPPALQTLALLYLTETLPPGVGSLSKPYLLSITIKWGFPEGGKTEIYHLKVTARNLQSNDATTPPVRARVTFDVEQLN